MTSTIAPPGAADISPKLKRAVGTNTTGLVERAILRKDDVAAQKALLAQQDTTVVDFKRALGALTRSDPSPETAKYLGQALADAKRRPTNRAVAAVYLASCRVGSSRSHCWQRSS